MLSLTQIEALAPDQSALAAASKLLKPDGWPLLATDAGGTVVWGEAQGSGSAPYRLMFDPADRGHKCSCPSRKFPCKHVLALMWQYVEHPERFSIGAPAPWVADWLARRRPAAGRSPTANDEAAASISAIAPAEAPTDDPEAEARAAERRARVESAREVSVGAGLEALDVWIGDHLNAGLAGFPQRAQGACRAAAQRLVDAKAGALAARLDALPSSLLGRPEPLRPDFVIGQLGQLHLISAAWRRREALDPPLREDLRRTIGWAPRREDVLRCAGEWIVAGVRSVVQPDRLRRIETWLVGTESKAPEPARALLMDFVPVQTGATGDALPAGERFPAELIFYPSAAPLRAIIATRGPASALGVAPAGEPGLAAAFAAHQGRLAALPWLGDDLLVAGDGRIVEASGSLWVCDAEAGLSLPLPPEQAREAAPLLELELSGLSGVWDGQLFTLLAASTPFGPWFAEP